MLPQAGWVCETFYHPKWQDTKAVWHVTPWGSVLTGKGLNSWFQMYYIVHSCFTLTGGRCASIFVRLLPHQCLTLIRPQSALNFFYTLNNSAYRAPTAHHKTLLPFSKAGNSKIFFQRTLPILWAHSDCHLSKRVTVESRSGNLKALSVAFDLLCLSSNPFVHGDWALGSCLGNT